jgi:hypothetical protein
MAPTRINQSSSPHSPSGGVGKNPRLADDVTIDYMRRHNIPITRESYLGLSYGDPDVKLDAEGESMLPPELRKEEE